MARCHQGRRESDFPADQQAARREARSQQRAAALYRLAPQDQGADAYGGGRRARLTICWQVVPPGDSTLAFPIVRGDCCSFLLFGVNCPNQMAIGRRGKVMAEKRAEDPPE